MIVRTRRLRHRSRCSSRSKACSAPTTPWCWPSSCSACPRTSSGRRCATASSAPSLPGHRDAPRGLPDPAGLGEAGSAPATCCIWPSTTSARAAGRRQRRTPPKATAMLGLSAFWATVVKVELTDIVFAIDSILVAVAMSPKTLGHPHRRHSRHHHDAARDRPAAGDRRALSGARGRRVRHHRVGRRSSCCSSTCTPRATCTSRSRSGCRSGLIVVIFGVSFLYARAQEGKHAAKTEDAAKALWRRLRGLTSVLSRDSPERAALALVGRLRGASRRPGTCARSRALRFPRASAAVSGPRRAVRRRPSRRDGQRRPEP